MIKLELLINHYYIHPCDLQVLLQHFNRRRYEEGRGATHPSPSTPEDPLQGLIAGPQ